MLAVLLFGGVGLFLARTRPLSIDGILMGSDETPICPMSVNRWAAQRLEVIRDQLERAHSLYRSNGEALNAIGAGLTWIDDRIIDQRIGEARQELRVSVLKASRCLIQFQP